MKVVYMGTPDFAVGPLEAMIKAGHEVSAVVTQPDKQRGRGREVQMSPVKKCALKYGIPVFQPVKIKEEDAMEQLSLYPADIFVVAAFGQILPEKVLSMPRFGCINIHASLLPAYRGAAPINRVIINGEPYTGVTIMQMARGLDTGDMLLKEKVLIEPKETGESLHDKLMEAGARLIVEALPKIERGELIPEKQDDALSSYADKLDKSMGQIDWKKDAVSLERLVRGLNPWPGTYTRYRGKTLKIWEADVVKEAGDGQDDALTKEAVREPGKVAFAGKDFFDVASGDGYLRIHSLQIEGKRRMTAREFLLGYEIVPGLKLG